MINLIPLNAKIPFIGFIFLGIIYYLFPTENAMIDSWYYATCIKFKSELFNSHHLIYNLIGVCWMHIVTLFNGESETIVALNHMNALAATVCLFVLYGCLLRLKTERNTAFWLVIFCGVTFGFMRYATDAETYILPLLFSLLATFFFIGSANRKSLLMAGIFASVAILIHQLHIWWLIAMFVFILVQKPFKLRDLLLFFMPFLLIPATYIIAYICYDNHYTTFFQFITGEYSKGNAGLDFSFSSILLTFVNLIRTFIQVHGQIGYLFNEYKLICISLIVVCLIIVVYLLLKKDFKLKCTENENNSSYSSLFLMAFILHLVFALLSSGNAEFMVMLPFLLVLFVASKYSFENAILIKMITMLLFVWNLAVAIIPNALININKVDVQTKIMEENPDAFFIWKNKPLVENACAYKNGFNRRFNFIGHKTLYTRILDSLLNKNKSIYTDIPNPGSKFNRENLFSDENTVKVLKKYHLQTIDSFINLYGKNYIFLVQKSTD